MMTIFKGKGKLKNFHELKKCIGEEKEKKEGKKY
jgi:hypothetical protein